MKKAELNKLISDGMKLDDNVYTFFTMFSITNVLDV